MVATQEARASQVGVQVLADGGTAVDAAVATAFALAVTHPTAGNVGGGGFLLLRTASGDAVAYDFRETAPAGASPTMWLKDGRYDARRHHFSHLAVGVPGTVAGLHLAWKEHGTLPWKRLLEPAAQLECVVHVELRRASSLASQRELLLQGGLLEALQESIRGFGALDLLLILPGRGVPWLQGAVRGCLLLGPEPLPELDRRRMGQLREGPRPLPTAHPLRAQGQRRSP